MSKWLRRIRGALGMGLTWAVAWAPLGAIWALLPFVSPPDLAVVTTFVVQAVVFGFVGGAAFSIVLGMIEGRRSFDEMSLPRFAAWGVVGGVLMFVLLHTVGAAGLRLLGVPIPSFEFSQLIFDGVITLMLAGSAAGSLALARMAEPGLLQAGVGIDHEELVESEARELPGRTA